jgi:nicotinamidase-related amidase
MPSVNAEPYEFQFEPATTALVVIDMQRDFVDPGGFGEALGNDVSLLRAAVPPTQRVLAAAREAGLFVVHTREGHRPDLADCPPAKKARGRLENGIGDPGPMGRILVRGEYGHDIVDELKPLPGEPVVDKPGKGSFYATDLDGILKNRGIQQLVVCGVTTEVCVDHCPGGQRPRLRLPGAVRLRRLLLPGVSARGARNDQGPGRHLRLGGSIGGVLAGAS